MGTEQKYGKAIIDRFGRIHNYLRISVTQNCNFRCSYCMPDNKAKSYIKPLLSADDIFAITKLLSETGINKIRLTGGEPLSRPDIDEIFSRLNLIDITKAITTNGYLLDRYLNQLKENNFSKINISLDSLNEERFKSITGFDGLSRVLCNIHKAIEMGFEVKINMVVLNGINNDEIVDFAKLSLKHNLSVRFIEFMPFKDNNWSNNKTFRHEDILNRLMTELDLEELNVVNHTAKLYRIKEAQGTIGIISTLSHPFCGSCNRLRLTADGHLKSCLFGNDELDLLSAYRKGENLEELISEQIQSKALKHGGNNPFAKNCAHSTTKRNMYSIGG